MGIVGDCRQGDNGSDARTDGIMSLVNAEEADCIVIPIETANDTDTMRYDASEA
jgi:hypothetical protein